MSRRIVVIQGHPDPDGEHFGHALMDSYVHGARSAGHRVDVVNVAGLDFPLLRNQEEWRHGELPPPLLPAQRLIGAADHLVIFFPLWLGDMPAMLKGFMEQVFRPGFAFAEGAVGMGGKKPLAGKSARVVVTMGMPAFFYRWYFFAHSVKNVKRNILKFIGLRPVKISMIGMAEGMSSATREKWFRRMAALGEAAG